MDMTLRLHHPPATPSCYISTILISDTGPILCLLGPSSLECRQNLLVLSRHLSILGSMGMIYPTAVRLTVELWLLLFYFQRRSVFGVQTFFTPHSLLV
jgi:hypothetical protein